jgi:valyl-tRNA synthetase
LRDMAGRGVMLELPLTGRQIPLIADEWADPMLGSGCVKITPGHDANDYDVWQRHPEIGVIDLLNDDGTLNDSAPEKYRGLSVTKAREAVVADIEAAGLLVEVEDREIDLAHSDRSKKPIEPRRVDQWFMKMDELAQTAMDAVTTGRVKIVPDRYAKGYLDWLAEKRDWPIGRQLWWGHRIPVWESITTSGGVVDEHYEAKERQEQQDEITALSKYLIACKVPNEDYCIVPTERWQIRICTRNEKVHEALNALIQFHKSSEPQLLRPGQPISSVLYRVPGFEDATKAAYDVRFAHFLKRESDVLDTWFSSALWPISTMGWPEDTPELAKFYPTSTLITSRDIITLWVARMVISGLYNVGEVPFHKVYITPKILDGYGETMSKSKGNGVDPLDVIDKFGADALRFGLAHLTTETQDVRMPVEFECPHCGAMFAQTKKNRQLPRVECEKCGQPFSTQWAEKSEDKALPRGAVVSERFELGRNFANKLWNAARFSLINLAGEDAGCGMQRAGDGNPQPRILHPASLLLEDRWLLSRLTTITLDVQGALDQYRYADAARLLYDFAWNEFCSFYVEMTKARFAVPEQRQTAQRVLAYALDVLMRLLHPMMPFLTEEVWQLLGQAAPVRGIEQLRRAEESVCIAAWPEHNPSHLDATIEQQFADFQAVLGAVREARQRQNIPFKEELSFTVRCNEATAKLLEPMQPYFAQMARATAAEFGPAAQPTGVPISITLATQTGPIEVHVDVSRFIDVAAERKRLEKDRDNLAKQIKSIDAKLANKAFVEKAPPAIVQQQEDKREELRGQLSFVESALSTLGN